MGNWSDTYDSLNRLVSAKQTAAPPLPAPSPYSGDSLCWGYDPFGNRTAQSIQSTACPALPAQPAQTAFYNSANRSTSLDYDNSGDVGFDPTTGNQYLYDAEGRICAVAATPIPSMTVLTGYIYDAGGTRVAKGTISAWSCNPAVNGFKTVSDFVLGLGGEQVTEMGVDTTAGSGTATLVWQHTNVFAGGKLLGTYDKDGLHFYFDDPLGTRRAQTDYAGHLEQTCSSLPFGDQLACTGGDLQAPTEHHFTGKERDTESGNDYFGARYYSSAMGRFMSPDPLAWLEGQHDDDHDDSDHKKKEEFDTHIENPQQLNMYAYSLNNPLRFVDPDGNTPQDRVAKAIDLASQHIDYITGGGHPGNKNESKGLDCSGLVHQVFKADPNNELNVDGSAADVAASFKAHGEYSSNLKDAKAGDAIFFADDKGNIKHTGIVTGVDKNGNIKFVDAPHTGAKTRENTLQKDGSYGAGSKAVGVGRSKETKKPN